MIIKIQLILKFQIEDFTHKFSNTELDCLAYLGEFGEITLNDFCQEMVAKKIYKHKQSPRNFISDLIKDDLKLVIKTPDKKIRLNVPDVYMGGPCVLNLILGYK